MWVLFSRRRGTGGGGGGGWGCNNLEGMINKGKVHPEENKLESLSNTIQIYQGFIFTTNSWLAFFMDFKTTSLRRRHAKPCLYQYYTQHMGQLQHWLTTTGYFSNHFPVPVNKAVTNKKLSRLTNSPSGFFESCTAPFKMPQFFTRNNVFDTHASAYEIITSI